MSDCGCYTNSDGYWVLSPECESAEHDAWRKMLELVAEGIPRTTGPRRPKFIVLDGKMRLVEDVNGEGL